MLKRRLTNVDIKIIDIYSARKIKTKWIELNSVLKPLTNSDSPSVKSKGERLVSAIEETRRIVMIINRYRLKFVILV